MSYETQVAHRKASPQRNDYRGFTLRSAAKGASEAWASQCAVAAADLDRIRADVAEVRAMTSSFADEKRTLCGDLKELLATVREATTICKVVQRMEARPVPSMSVAPAELDAQRIDISISPPPSDFPGPRVARHSALHDAIQSVVPTASYPSPQPRAPNRAPIHAVVQRLPVTPDISEDDLVVLLLKRQLQRRELELKSLMEHQ